MFLAFGQWLWFTQYIYYKRKFLMTILFFVTRAFPLHFIHTDFGFCIYFACESTFFSLLSLDLINENIFWLVVCLLVLYTVLCAIWFMWVLFLFHSIVCLFRRRRIFSFSCFFFFFSFIFLFVFYFTSFIQIAFIFHFTKWNCKHIVRRVCNFQTNDARWRLTAQ